MKQDIVKLRHDRSQRDHPDLKLEENEFVELYAPRAKVGLWFMTAGLIVGAVVLTVLLLILLTSAGETPEEGQNRGFLVPLICILYLAIILVGVINSKVYRENKLYVTNRRLIHVSKQIPFAQATDSVELTAIEDINFKQTNVLQYMFHFGTLQISTANSNEDHTFKFIEQPSEIAEKISTLVHDAKEEN